MQKCLSITLLLLFPALLHAQRGQNAKPAWKPKHNVTKFLGIPVDGSKWTMIQKLKEKGFVRLPYKKDILEGEFNGENVYVEIFTYNNKVRRIMVRDKRPSGENQIKRRYNKLIQQFRNNSKYTEFEAEEISENEISFDTNVDNDKYHARFLQAPWDNEMYMRLVWFNIFKEPYGYYIMIFYENRFNQANGEDL